VVGRQSLAEHPWEIHRRAATARKPAAIDLRVHIVAGSAAKAGFDCCCVAAARDRKGGGVNFEEQNPLHTRPFFLYAPREKGKRGQNRGQLPAGRSGKLFLFFMIHPSMRTVCRCLVNLTWYSSTQKLRLSGANGRNSKGQDTWWCSSRAAH